MGKDWGSSAYQKLVFYGIPGIIIVGILVIKLLGD
jgi:hypothetical protein